MTFSLDQVVDAVDLLPDALQVQAALHDLDAQVVLFVDHQAELLVAVDGHGAGALALGVLAADQLAFDEELAIDALELVHVDVEHAVVATSPAASMAARSRARPSRCGSIVVALRG